MKNPEFLKQKYDLHKSPEVESAAGRTKARMKEKVPQNPNDRIQNYLDRFSDILDREDTDKRERGIEAFKHVFHNKFIIKPEEIPESYFDAQRRIAREQGHGDIEITDEMRDQAADIIIADQRSSLDKWVNYFSLPDAAVYPDWLKYYATRSVVGLGEYDKKEKEFAKRSKGTTKPFPDLDREALSYVFDALEKKYKGEKKDLATLEAGDKKEFEELLKGENFAKLYAWAIEKATPESKDKLTITEGKWVKYEKGSDHASLVQSLQGHGTGWCTAGESTAQKQLEGGDFYVYYSLDRDGSPTVPRTAIRMQGNSIAEVRGIGTEQNLDPYIGGVVQEKLKEFPDGKRYEKKVSDMKFLTAVEEKIKSRQELPRDDLIFLYEVNAPIRGFGYEKDPRIKQLLRGRNEHHDMLTMFECTDEQIARGPNEIKEDTKVYIGKLAPGIFNRPGKDIEHVYRYFPEEKIRKDSIEIGGKAFEELKNDLHEGKINVTADAEKILESDEFATPQNVERIDIIRLKTGDIGVTIGTVDEVYRRAKEFGLELCPVDTGPQYILACADQITDNSIWVAMEQINGSDGNPRIFLIKGGDIGGLKLDGFTTKPGQKFYNNEFIFRLPKKES